MRQASMAEIAPHERRRRLLYPAVLVAAVAVTLFSAIGIATMTGLIPGARSESAPAVDKAQPPQSRPSTGVRPSRAPAASACTECGVVESIVAVQDKGGSSGLGAILGGVIGGILGNQVGGGSGRTAMTVVGAGAGAYAGHEVERNMNRPVRYQVRVRMDDGTVQTFYHAAPPALAVGQKVRATENGLISIG